MLDWITRYAEAILALITALGVIFGGAWAVARFTVERHILNALDKQRDSYKSWNVRLFQSEFERNENSARAIDAIQTSLDHFAKELQQIRVNTTRHDETMIALPGILANLNDTLSRHARTDDRLGDTLIQMSKDVNETKIRIAHIMGKLDMKARSDIAEITSSPR